MSLSRFELALRERPRHLCAFTMLGDPTPELSFELACAAVASGASMLELGLPFSDPCADGPAIQRACQRALAAGTSTAGALSTLARIHAALPNVPLHLLVYGNLVHARGYGEFCRAAADAGASTLLVPDLPLEESAPLRAAAADAGLGHSALVGPSTPRARLFEYDRTATGYLYLAGYQGVTGREAADPNAYESTVAAVAARVHRPVCAGFGISTPAHVRSALRGGARMAVVGSHLVRAIERGRADGTEIERFCAALTPLTGAVHEMSSEQHTNGELRCS